MDGVGRDKADADPVTEFTTESSCWRTVLSDVDPVDNAYFFGTQSNDRDTTSILSEFGWNLAPPTNSAEPGGSRGEFDRIIMDSDLAGNDDDNNTATTSTTSFVAHQNSSSALAASSSAATTSGSVAAVLADVEAEQQPMASSSSSEDVPEKSTASGGSADRPPSESA